MKAAVLLLAVALLLAPQAQGLFGRKKGPEECADKGEEEPKMAAPPAARGGPRAGGAQRLSPRGSGNAWEDEVRGPIQIATLRWREIGLSVSYPFPL